MHECWCKPHKTVVNKDFANDASMYSSPAYGTHQVFAEPGLDHLYESTDGII